jgi:hypothetical protein
MKSMGVIVLFPLLSVIILSLYGAGGASRVAAVVLLALSVVGLAGLLLSAGQARGSSPI